MTYQPKIRNIDGKDQIFCEWRRKFVRLTPEEWVRQYILHLLVEEYSYPQARIAVEMAIRVGERNKRCDAVVYNATLQPVCLIEFKADTVALTQQVFDQAAIYNRELGVDLFLISNGKQTVVCRVTPTGYDFLTVIPNYNDL